MQQLRLENTRKLISAIGGIKAFAEKLGKPSSQISAVAGKNPTRNIGDKLANDIETEFGLEHGWLSKNHEPEFAPVPLLDYPSMLHYARNFSLFDYAALAESGHLVSIPKRLIGSGEQLVATHVPSTSMNPVFPPDSYLVVDFEGVIEKRKFAALMVNDELRYGFLLDEHIETLDFKTISYDEPSLKYVGIVVAVTAGDLVDTSASGKASIEETGKLLISLSKDLLARIERSARASRRHLNAQIAHTLEMGLDKEQEIQEMIRENEEWEERVKEYGEPDLGADISSADYDKIVHKIDDIESQLSAILAHVKDNQPKG